MKVEVCECANDNLAVHPISHSSVSGNQVGEILKIKYHFTLILIDLFNPEAKNPPNGPIILAKSPIITT